MLQAIKTRELIALDGLGSPIHGTLHRPPDRFFGPSAAGKAGIPGILFLNSLSLPRAATGDSAVHWADSCAELGYPSFRFDLPGLGDSAGDIPTDLLDFINSGGYASIAVASVKELVERMGLSGVVIIGHCAGSVSALFAAAASKECKGLILMDPYFHLPQMIRPTVRRKLSEWARSSKIGGVVSDIYDRGSDLLLHVRGERPPGNANFRLLNCWKQVTTTGMPVLMLKAPGLKAAGTKPRRGQFDYLTHVMKLAGNKNQVTIKLIEGTDHSFANRTGRAAVRHQIGSWLERYFPLAGSEENAQNSISAQRARDNQSNCLKTQRVPARVSLHRGGKIILAMDVRSEVIAQFKRVAEEQDKRIAHLTNDLALLDSGLDSLCFAIVVTRLELSLGVDPFSTDEDARFPETFGDFVSLYENAPR